MQCKHLEFDKHLDTLRWKMLFKFKGLYLCIYSWEKLKWDWLSVKNCQTEIEFLLDCCLEDSSCCLRDLCGKIYKCITVQWVEHRTRNGKDYTTSDLSYFVIFDMSFHPTLILFPIYSQSYLLWQISMYKERRQDLGAPILQFSVILQEYFQSFIVSLNLHLTSSERVTVS